MTLSFHDQLVRDTAAEMVEFMSIPLITHAIGQGVERQLYLDFLACAYHHVKHTCPLLGLALSHCGEEDKVYRSGLLAYLDEEKGHEEWILDDIAALNGNVEVVRTALPPLSVRLMVAYAYHAIERISPYALLGMVHVLEGMSVALARSAANSIIGRLGLSPEADGRIGGFSYLISHGHLDEDHVQLFAGLLAEIDCPDRRQVVIQAAKDFYRLYGDIFRELGVDWRLDHAA